MYDACLWLLDDDITDIDSEVSESGTMGCTYTPCSEGRCDY